MTPFAKRIRHVFVAFPLLSLLSLEPAVAAEPLTFTPADLPWSAPGAWLAISHRKAAQDRPEGLYLRVVHGLAQDRTAYRVEMLIDGKPLAAKEVKATATAGSLKLESKGAEVALAFDGPRALRLRGHGAGLRFSLVKATIMNTAFPMGKGQFSVNNSPNGISFMATPRVGSLNVDAPWNGVFSDKVVIDFLPDTAGATEGVLDEYQSVWHPNAYTTSFDSVVKARQDDFDAFLTTLPSVTAADARGSTVAGYVLWANQVGPEGLFRRPTIYLSKNNIVGLFSWENSFAALALAQRNPKLAWDQFMIPFDLQDPEGKLPDRMDDRMIDWSFVKPPLHGWALRGLMARNAYFRDRARLATIYGPLSKWTQWWLTYRDSDHDGLPEYNHGMESVWENSPVFLAGLPTESPDLATWLVLQMDVLADVAKRIGKKSEAVAWTKKADALTKQMLEAYWKTDHFIATGSGSGGSKGVSQGDALLMMMPLLLGDRLPADIKQTLIAGLTKDGRFWTSHGLASESLTSPFHEPRGLWRGPIWGPMAVIFADAFRQAGRDDLAMELARNFSETARSTFMPELFEAANGRGNPNPGYAWTASTYLIMANALSLPTAKR